MFYSIIISETVEKYYRDGYSPGGARMTRAAEKSRQKNNRERAAIKSN
jgi:hypothetical protein